ncbi:MAG TPA: SDR family NAD(P)-dependent oxidoreductase [Candidatus Binataceae bacterium]
MTHLGGGETFLAVAVDVTNEAQVKSGVGEGLSRFGGIDVLVNNAGVGTLGAIEETTAEEVDHLFRTNVFGLLNVTRAELPSMRRQRAGHIINLSSLGAYRASAGWGVYCSTKFAVEGLTEALHDELAPLGIHATVVEPGFFRTDFMDNRSLSKAEHQIADYADTVGKTRAFAVERNHHSPAIRPNSPRRSSNLQTRLTRRCDCRWVKMRSLALRTRTPLWPEKLQSGAPWPSPPAISEWLAPACSASQNSVDTVNK